MTKHQVSPLQFWHSGHTDGRSMSVAVQTLNIVRAEPPADRLVNIVNIISSGIITHVQCHYSIASCYAVWRLGTLQHSWGLFQSSWCINVVACSWCGNSTRHLPHLHHRAGHSHHQLHPSCFWDYWWRVCAIYSAVIWQPLCNQRLESGHCPSSGRRSVVIAHALQLLITTDALH